MNGKTTLAQGPAPAAQMPPAGRILQRQCACGNHSAGGGECEDCQEKRRLQRRASGRAGGPAPGLVHQVLGSPGQPLDAATRAFMEPRFGSDFSAVRVHTDARAAASARSVNALAYTVGRDVVFAQGRFAPGTESGRRLLAHELAHTLQQGAAPASPQAKLEIDAADSPLEAAADRAADAALRGGPVPIQPLAAPALSRQVADTRSSETRSECRGSAAVDLTHIDLPTADAPSGRYTIAGVETVSDNERRVRLSTGRRYLVRRNPWTTTDEVPTTTGGATPGMDRDQVWLDIEFCRGSTEGTIRVGANVPEQVIQLLLRTLSSGGDVGAAWRQASITPTVSGSLKVGHWRVDLSAHTTVDSSGHDTGVGGEASVSTDTGRGRVTVGGSAESQDVGGNPLGGATGQVFFRFEWGASQTPPHCTTQRVRSGFTYECREERDVAPRARPGTQGVTTTDERVYNLFFRYAVPEFDEPRNRDSWRDLAADLAAGSGYQVARIEGWASPEGPLAPGAGGFMGNTELSNRRAEAARARIAALCRDCFAPGAEVAGHGERLDPTDDQGQPQDAAGRPLEEHVSQSFPTDPGEATVRTPQLMDRLRRARTPHARSEQIYPELRRAIVTLRRSATRTDDCSYTVPGHTEEAYLPSCPDDIRRAAFPDTATP